MVVGYEPSNSSVAQTTVGNMTMILAGSFDKEALDNLLQNEDDKSLEKGHKSPDGHTNQHLIKEDTERDTEREQERSLTTTDEMMTRNKSMTDVHGKRTHNPETRGFADARTARARLETVSNTTTKCIRYPFVDWVTNAPAKIQYKDGRNTTLTELFLAHREDFPGVDTVGWNTECTLILRHASSKMEQARVTADNLRSILLKHISEDSIITLQGGKITSGMQQMSKIQSSGEHKETADLLPLVIKVDTLINTKSAGQMTFMEWLQDTADYNVID